MKMKRLIAVILCLVMVCAAFGGCAPKENEQIVIGVSTWSVQDALGSQVKGIIDAAAKVLDVKVVYIEQSHKSEEVVSSIENLCASGVQGIILCNSADAEMAQAIPIAQKNGVYLSQFFRVINDPAVEKIAKANKYYLGCTHEDEEKNGFALGTILVKDKGCRTIGMTSYRVGDATANARIDGYKRAIAEWNTANPTDLATLLPIADDKFTAEEARQAVEAMIDANPKMDGLVVVGGGGSPLEGAIQAVSAKNKTGKIAVCSTDFTTTLDKQLEAGEISAMSGGHYADPLFSFMMVYNAIKGNYNRTDAEYLEVVFPMMNVASAKDYAAFDKYFVKELPYTNEELLAMSKGSFAELQKTAANLSIADVEKRHG